MVRRRVQKRSPWVNPMAEVEKITATNVVLNRKGDRMSMYAGIDLHANNSFIGISDEGDRRIIGRRCTNDRDRIFEMLSPYKRDLRGVVVESTFNWYWLVDALMKEGYRVHLANPSAIQQYKGLKYTDDRHDAFWLARMLRLGILPEGYIYPKDQRGIRDLLRQRSRFVEHRTAMKHLLQQMCSNQTGLHLGNNALTNIKDEDLDKIFVEEMWIANGKSTHATINFLDERINEIERLVLHKMKEDWSYRHLTSVPGIGEILGLTISLETGPVERFGSPGEYASYCRCVPSGYWSNEKKKGAGNKKNGNKYLSWAYAEAATFCIRFCKEAKIYYQRKCAGRNKPVAYRAISNKLAKACYFIMRDGTEFDAKRLFG